MKFGAVRMKFKLSSGCSVGEFLTGFVVPIGKHRRNYAYLGQVLVNAAGNSLDTYISSAPLSGSGSINEVAYGRWKPTQLLSNGPEFEVSSSYNATGIGTVLLHGKKVAGKVSLQLPKKAPKLPAGFVSIIADYETPPGSIFTCVVRVRSIQGFY